MLVKMKTRSLGKVPGSQHMFDTPFLHKLWSTCKLTSVHTYSIFNL